MPIRPIKPAETDGEHDSTFPLVVTKKSVHHKMALKSLKCSPKGAFVLFTSGWRFRETPKADSVTTSFMSHETVTFF